MDTDVALITASGADDHSNGDVDVSLPIIFVGEVMSMAPFKRLQSDQGQASDMR